MADEKPGGHGERSVAVGALDMALWDVAAKLVEQPLYRVIADRFQTVPKAKIPVYAGGGYYYPASDLDHLKDEIKGFVDRGYTQVKIKIGSRPLPEDIRRIEAALSLLPSGRNLAVDAMNRYTPKTALEAARAFETHNLLWFEDPMDPLDFEAHRALAESYGSPIGIGEATFSAADARNLIRYAGLRPDRDRLLFDPAHCYGIPEFVRIVELFESAGWSLQAFYPHGGHLFSLHVAAGLGLGGCEANPDIFQPFGGFAESTMIDNGFASPPEAPGIGFETRPNLRDFFKNLR
jgi:L-alanine-DL-glutamate epimerase-like enolase superfamily enzyme